MAKLQVMTLANLTEFKGLNDSAVDTRIANAVSSAFKSVSVSNDGYIIYFYTVDSPTSIDEAAYSINLPSPVNISGKADKVKNAVAGNLAGLDASGNLTDSGKKAADFEIAGAADTAKNALMSYIGNIPEAAVAKTIVAYIQEVVAASAYDDTSVRALINANLAALNVLNGTGAGSVSKTVYDAVAEIIAGAPESRDTLKEISDWIDSHASDAAGMNSQINTNKTDIGNLKTLIGQLPEGSASTTLVAYIAEYVSKALADSDLAQYAKASDLQAALTRVGALEKGLAETNTAATALSGRVTTAEGAIATVEENVASAQAGVDANAAAITGLKTIVGDGVEAIPSSAIKALFSV